MGPEERTKWVLSDSDLEGQIARAIRAAIEEEREACKAAVQALLDGDFCGSDTEALQAAIGAIEGRGE